MKERDYWPNNVMTDYHMNNNVKGHKAMLIRPIYTHVNVVLPHSVMSGVQLHNIFSHFSSRGIQG